MTGLYFLNGMDMYTAFGFIPEEGCSDDFLKPRNRKAVYENDWADESGKEYDLASVPVYEDRIFTLKGYIRGNNEADFWNKYNSLLASFNTVGVHVLTVGEFSGNPELSQGFKVFIRAYTQAQRYTRVKGDNTVMAAISIEVQEVRDIDGMIIGGGVILKDVLSSESELPSNPSLGSGYLVSGNLLVWDGVNWVDVSDIRGEQGIQGLKGDKGDKGEQGIQGLKGDKGDKGDTGLQGIQGEKGDQGIQGLPGTDGATGNKGDKGDKGDTGLQGIQGEKGDQGIQGLPGQSLTLGAAGQIPFTKSGGSDLDYSSNLFFDKGNGRLGIRTTSPSESLDVVGNGKFSTGLIGSYATENTVASFNANKEIVSLDTSIFPSLAELAYVKGVTNNIQAQINAKVSFTKINNLAELNAYIADPITNDIYITGVIDLTTLSKTLPTNTIVNYFGGKFTNGTLVGNNTIIHNLDNKQLFDNVAIQGTWKVEKAHSDWFKTWHDGYVLDKEMRLDGNGDRYFISKVNEGGTQFYVNNTTYDFGVSTGLTYHDDTVALQQLLNLKADYTTIGNAGEVFMIDANNGQNIRGRTDFGGLLVELFDDKIIEIKGVLKAIRNDKTSSSILRVGFCKGLTITGHGGIDGELFEHEGNSGEWGIGIFVHSCVDLTVKNIAIRDCWGDGVFSSYSKMGDWQLNPIEIKRKETNERHTWENVKIYDCGRTGFVYEIGNYVDVVNCDISFNARHRWKQMAAGVDVEPFGSADAGMRTCLFFKFQKCVFVENRNANLRFERCGNLVIDNNYFEGGNSGISLINCMTGSYDTGFALNKNNTFNYGGLPLVGQCIVTNNNAYKIRSSFLQSESFESFNAQFNTITKCGLFISGNIRNTLIRDNVVYNSCVFCSLGIMHNVDILNNVIHHLSLDYVKEENVWYSAAFKFGETWRGLPPIEFPQFVMYNVNVIDNKYYDYVGNNSLREFRSSTPLIRTSRILIIYTHGLNENVDEARGVVIKNNIFPRETMMTYLIHLRNDQLMNRLPTNYDYSCEIQPNEMHMFMVGDTWFDTSYNQRAKVIAGGVFKNSDKWVKWEVDKVITVNMVGKLLYFESPNIVYCIKNSGVLGGSMPSMGWEITSGDVVLAYYEDASPDPTTVVVKWEGVGNCTTATRPIEFNSKGRQLWDETIDQLITWNGIKWILNDGSDA